MRPSSPQRRLLAETDFSRRKLDRTQNDIGSRLKSLRSEVRSLNVSKAWMEVLKRMFDWVDDIVTPPKGRWRGVIDHPLSVSTVLMARPPKGIGTDPTNPSFQWVKNWGVDRFSSFNQAIKDALRNNSERKVDFVLELISWAISEAKEEEQRKQEYLAWKAEQNK